MRKHAIRAAVIGVTVGLLSFVAIRPQSSSAQTSVNNGGGNSSGGSAPSGPVNTAPTGQTSQCNSCGGGMAGGQ